MTKRKNILLVSLIAMLSVGAVRAETATTTYVDNQDNKLADRIQTQDARIGLIRDWVNPQDANKQRATLTTTAKDAYRAINELDAAIKAIPEPVKPDWNAAAGNAAEILNKPEIVSPSELQNELADKQDKLTFDNTPTENSENPVTSGGIYTAINAMSGDVASIGEQIDDKLEGYATEEYVDEKVAAVPAQVSSDWNATSGVAQILNKPEIPTADEIVSPSELQSALADKQDTIANLSDIAAGAALGATAVQPDDLATVATSGKYEDLANTPEIPAAQVNADWNATSGVAQILNKPDLSQYATTAAMDEALDDVAADVVALDTQINGDPNNANDGLAGAVASNEAAIGLLTTNVAGKQDKIENLDTIVAGAAAGATAVQPTALADYATKASLEDYAKTADIKQPVQSNWNETNADALSYIQNKPDVYTKTEVDQQITQAALDGNVTVDTALSTSSTNPVQNKVVTNALPNFDTTTGGVVEVPSEHGAYVLGYVNGKPAYIAVVDANGDSGVDVPWGE